MTTDAARPIRSLALLGLLTLSLACASNGGGEPTAESAAAPSLLSAGSRIGSIEVSSEIAAGTNRSQFEKYDVASRTQVALETSLRTSGHLDPAGDLSLAVIATNFRLRGGATAFWLGGMAGSDFYNVRVEVSRGAEVIRSFDTNTSTILGGIAYASPTGRSNGMIASLVERVRRGL